MSSKKKTAAAPAKSNVRTVAERRESMLSQAKKEREAAQMFLDAVVPANVNVQNFHRNNKNDAAACIARAEALEKKASELSE